MVRWMTWFRVYPVRGWAPGFPDAPIAERLVNGVNRVRP